jgi:hypothetical protein
VVGVIFRVSEETGRDNWDGLTIEGDPAGCAGRTVTPAGCAQIPVT